MSISRIPEPKFVKCSDCTLKQKKQVLKKSGRGKETLYYCSQTTPWRRLFGQKGCTEGVKQR